jgi:hypothetical protein
MNSRHHNRLGSFLSLGQFEQTFTAILPARHRYLEDRW